MSKEASVIVIDIGRFMDVEDLASAKKTALAFVQNKLLFTTQDEIGVLLVGSNGTKNTLNAEKKNEYLHVSVLADITKPTLEMYSNINDIERNEAAGDILDAIVVAVYGIVFKVL